MSAKTHSCFCFSADTTSGTHYVVNVVGNDEVGAPMTRAMDPVSETFLDDHGLDNLIVPISVGPPEELPDKDPYDFCVDVVVHSWLTTKAIGPHRLREHFVMKLTALSIEWVLQECGARLVERTCKYLGGPMYYVNPTAAVPMADMLKQAAAMLKKQHEKQQSESSSAPNDSPQCFNIASSGSERQQPPKGPLIREVIAEPLIKKGFLVDNKKQLYGPEGSNEGTGKPYDELAHIPASLREKCHIVDTRNPQPTTVSLPAKPEEAPARPEWTLQSVDTVEDKVTIRLLAPPHIQRMSDVDLAVSDDTVEVDGRNIKLPSLVDADSTKAKYVKATRTLVITCTCK